MGQSWANDDRLFGAVLGLADQPPLSELKVTLTQVVEQRRQDLVPYLVPLLTKEHITHFAQLVCLHDWPEGLNATRHHRYNLQREVYRQALLSDPFPTRLSQLPWVPFTSDYGYCRTTDALHHILQRNQFLDYSQLWNSALENERWDFIQILSRHYFPLDPQERTEAAALNRRFNALHQPWTNLIAPYLV